MSYSVRAWGVAYIIWNPLTPCTPLKIAWLSCNALEGFERFSIQPSVWTLSAVVGKEIVSEQVRRRGDYECEWPCEETPVGSNRVVEACSSKLVHNGEIITVWALRHCHKLLVLEQVKSYWVATVAS